MRSAHTDSLGQMEGKMAAKAPQKSRPMPVEAQATQQGGWITFPFITGSLMGQSVASVGVTSNLIVYLINQYNIKSIDAAQISSMVLGCANIAPVVGAIISDSYFGCFAVVAAANFVSFLAMALFTLTATIPSLRPAPCAAWSNTCQAASPPQLAVLYAAVALMCVAAGGTGFNTAALGANQFDSAGDRATFFDWYMMALRTSSVIGATGVVYVEDSVSWGWGFGVCTVASAVSVVVLLVGSRHYRRPRPVGSPFTGLAQVVVAALRKWKVAAPTEPVGYYNGPRVPLLRPRSPTGSFRCFNPAAVETEGDTNVDSSIAKPWRLCTVEQVEDLKTILRILPLWSTTILISICIGIQGSLTVLQALTVDRSLGPRFSIPAGSLIVSSFASSAVSLLLLDRCAFPVWRKLTRSGRDPSPLQRMGLGQVINVAAIAASALVERRRMSIVRAHHPVDEPGSVVPMTVLWLLLPLVLMGVGEAVGFPGKVALYYQEFPAALKGSAVGLISLTIALGFYLSTAVVELVRKVTDWLPDNVNASKLDRVYWVLVVGGVLNVGVYVMFARGYTAYQAMKEKERAGVAPEQDGHSV